MSNGEVALMKRLVVAGLLSSVALGCAAAGHPVLLSGALLHGGIFSDPRAKTLDETSDSGTVGAHDLVAHESGDGCLQTGVYETGPNRYRIEEPYPHDEFMYFLKGGVTLSSADGTVTEVSAGDAVLLPKGWTGQWDSGGYRKIYVIHDCTD
jgi:uncharacterized cupin superfamily protein